MTSKVIYHPTNPAKNEYFVNGQPVSQADYEAAHPSNLDFSTPPGGMRPACWPMYSDALAVHASQVQEASENARKIGVPTEYLPDGRAVLRDQAHRRELARANHMLDRNAGYGDPTP